MSVLVTDYPTIGYHRGYEIKEIPANTAGWEFDVMVLWCPISQCHMDWIKDRPHSGSLEKTLNLMANMLDQRSNKFDAHS